MNKYCVNKHNKIVDSSVLSNLIILCSYFIVFFKSPRMITIKNNKEEDNNNKQQTSNARAFQNLDSSLVLEK